MGAQKPLIAIIVMLLAISSAYIFSDDIFDDSGVPSAPLNLSARAGVGVVYLDWDPPSTDGGSEILEYRIYAYNDTSANLGFDPYVNKTNSLQFSCEYLSAGVTYHFRVTAVNAKGASPMANTSAVPISATGNLTVYFIDVGQGDAILIQTPDMKNILIDSGTGTIATYSALNSFLMSKSVTTIDVMVATHPDEDHIGGLDNILYDYEVLSVYDSGFYKDTVAYRNFRTAIDLEGCPYYNDTHIDPGNIMDWSSEVQFTIIHIDASAKITNDASIVIMMSFGTVDFLLMGDAESGVESSILPLFNLDVEILKVGHHGSDTSSTASFIEEVSPDVAIISVGANKYGHPSPDTLSKLEESGAEDSTAPI